MATHLNHPRGILKVMQTIGSRARATTAGAVLILAGALSAGGLAHAQAKAGPYPAMAPLSAYRTQSRAEEIAMARSAAPASVSDKAEVLVLGDKGYETAAKGSNGFSCIVQRSWANDFGSAEFWNPKARAPICFNPASARTVLPTYLMRTSWVLSGISVEEMASKTRDALASGAIPSPEPGAMCYMMSKHGYTDDAAAGPWRAHLMFYVPRAQPETWGANLPGSPVIGGASSIEPLSVFIVPVPNWSDGSPDHGH